MTDGSIGVGMHRARPTWVVVTVASVPMFMAALDNLVVTNALPVLSVELSAGLSDLQWFINAYTLSFASLILPAVALGDRFGRRRVFAAGLLVFTVASAGCALSDRPEELIAWRAIEGVGAAALVPLSLTLVATSVPERHRSLAIGVWGGISGLGVALGPLIGGAVVDGLSWQAIFWLNVPIGLLALPAIVAVLPESFGRPERVDGTGVLLALVGVFGLVYGIVQGGEQGWTSPPVLAGFAAGLVGLGLFIGWQRVARAPLLPLSLFRDRSFTVANVVGVLFSFGMFGAIFILIQFLQVVQGHSALDAGVLTMPWTLAPLVVAPLAGAVVDRVGTRVLLVAGLVAVTVALLWIALVLSPTTSYRSLVGAFLLAGIGMGLIFSPIATAVLATMRDEDKAKASGANSSLREVGVALGIAVLGAVFSAAGGELTPTGYVDAAVPAVVLGAAVLGVAAAVALALPAHRTAPVPPVAV